MARVTTNNRHYSDIADAIREKRGSVDTYKPREMAAAIRGINTNGDLYWICTAAVGTGLIPPTPASDTFDLPNAGISFRTSARARPEQITIVPWSTGTDEQIAAMVDALDIGALSIADTGWQIGDERQVALSAMAATGVGEAHASQTVTMVLMDSGHYELVGGGRDHFTVGLKDCLDEAGYINSSASNAGSWAASARRAWCNEVFRASIPAALRNCFKKFKCVSATSYQGTTITVSEDYFALFAEAEVFAERDYSNPQEAGTVTRVAYYTTAANRIKQRASANAAWFDRSPHSSDRFCATSNDGSAGYETANVPVGIAPFGCI